MVAWRRRSFRPSPPCREKRAGGNSQRAGGKKHGPPLPNGKERAAKSASKSAGLPPCASRWRACAVASMSGPSPLCICTASAASYALIVCAARPLREAEILPHRLQKSAMREMALERWAWGRICAHLRWCARTEPDAGGAAAGRLNGARGDRSSTSPNSKVPSAESRASAAHPHN